MLAGLDVEHELAERAVEARHRPTQESEPRAREPCAGFEVHAQRRCQIGVFAWGKIEIARRAPAADLDIVFFAGAEWHVISSQVGDDVERGL